MKKTGQASDDPMERIARSLNILVKLKIADCQGDRIQKDMILFLADLGCTTSEIAEYLHTTVANVAPTVSRAKSSSKKNAKSRTKRD
jgi:hypothetical protein